MATTTYDSRQTRFLPRLQWGPIIAGVLVSLAAHVVLGLFGISFGFGAEAASSEGVGAGASIWGVLTPLIATCLGAWVCVRLLNETHGASDHLHGVMVWCIGLIAGALFLTSAMGGIFSTNTLTGRYIDANRINKAGSVSRERNQDEAAKGAAAASGGAGVAALFGLAGAFAGAAIGRRQVMGQPVFGNVFDRNRHGSDYRRDEYAQRDTRLYTPSGDRVTQAGSLSSPAGMGQSTGMYENRRESTIITPGSPADSGSSLRDPYDTQH